MTKRHGTDLPKEHHLFSFFRCIKVHIALIFMELVLHEINRQLVNYNMTKENIY